MIGVAQTGSGKTLAFVWPALVHLMDQREIVKGKEGPIVVVLAPTRELAGQIYQEANKFAKRCVPVVQYQTVVHILRELNPLRRGDLRFLCGKRSPRGGRCGRRRVCL